MYRSTGGTLPVMLILDTDDAPKYKELALPDQWAVHVGDHKPMLYRLMEAFEVVRGQPFYGFIGDDALPLTPGWDRALRDSAGYWGIAYAWDGIQNEKQVSHWVVGGKLAEAVGYFSPPGLKHLYIDNVWTEIGKALGCLKYHEEIKIEHLHFSNYKSEWDDTYHLHGQYAGQDRELFDVWRNGELEEIIKRVRAAKARDYNGNL